MFAVFDECKMKGAIRFESVHKPRKCPSCGSTCVAQILYGLPLFSPKLKEDLTAGRISIVGCCETGYDQNWKCMNCQLLFMGDELDRKRYDDVYKIIFKIII